MSEPEVPRLPGDQVHQMLASLNWLAREIKMRGEPPPERLREVLNMVPLREPWAFRELELWSRFLAHAHRYRDPGTRSAMREELMRRGVPEAQATLALMEAAADEPLGGTIPINNLPPEDTTGRRSSAPTTPTPSAGLRCSPEVIGMGVLKPGGFAKATLRVEGGPGKVRVATNRIQVRPGRFGPEPTDIEVFVKGSRGNLLLLSSLVVETERERATVDVIAYSVGHPPEPIVKGRKVVQAAPVPVAAPLPPPPPPPPARPLDSPPPPASPRVQEVPSKRGSAAAEEEPRPQPRGPQWSPARKGTNG